MIPLRDDKPIRIFPFVTLAIIALNLIVYLYALNPLDGMEKKWLLFGTIPYRLTHAHDPLVMVTLVTALFFHADLLHLFGNMLYLWVFGNNIEEKLGHLKFIYFYLLCGILASLAFVLIIPNSRLPLIGASGAISGVLGAYFLLYPEAKLDVLFPFLIFWKRIKMRAIWFLLLWIILQFLYGAVSIQAPEKEGVAWLAHIIGFITGAFLVTLFSKPKDITKI